MSAGAIPLAGGWPQKAQKALRAVALPMVAISMVFVMLVPVPSFVLDMLLVAR